MLFSVDMNRITTLRRLKLFQVMSVFRLSMCYLQNLFINKVPGRELWVSSSCLVAANFCLLLLIISYTPDITRYA